MSNYIKILYEQLNGNKDSVLYLKSYKKNLSKNELNKLKKSKYEGDNNLYNIIIKQNKNNTIENNKEEFDDDKNNSIPIVIKRIRKNKTYLVHYKDFMHRIVRFMVM